MVRQSVFDDLKATLTAADWIGSTPMALLSTPVKLIDAFPEKGILAGNAPEPNTLALDNGTPGEQELGELGGFMERPYQFGIMFYAESDAVGLALFSDLADRYLGLTASPYITLYDYSQSPAAEVVRMEVETFNYGRAPEDIAPYEQHLFFGELIITDYVDQA